MGHLFCAVEFMADPRRWPKPEQKTKSPSNLYTDLKGCIRLTVRSRGSQPGARFRESFFGTDERQVFWLTPFAEGLPVPASRISGIRLGNLLPLEAWGYSG